MELTKLQDQVAAERRELPWRRIVEVMMGAYRLMDLTPRGRNERDVFYKMEWVRHHDRYEAGQRFEPAPEKLAPTTAACPRCEA